MPVMSTPTGESVHPASSGCQSNVNGLFRNHLRYSSRSTSRNAQNSNIMDDLQINSQRTNNNNTQVTLNGKCTFSIVRNKNNSVDIPKTNFCDLNLKNDGNLDLVKTTLHNNNEEENEYISSVAPRTYAKMIADYSEVMFKEQDSIMKIEKIKPLISKISFPNGLLRNENLTKNEIGISVAKFEDCQKRNFVTKRLEDNEDIDVEFNEKISELAKNIIETEHNRRNLNTKNSLIMFNDCEINDNYIFHKLRDQSDEQNPILKWKKQKIKSKHIIIDDPTTLDIPIIDPIEEDTDECNCKMKIAIDTNIQCTKRMQSNALNVNINVQAPTFFLDKSHTNKDVFNLVKRCHHSNSINTNDAKIFNKNNSDPFYLPQNVKMSSSRPTDKLIGLKTKRIRNIKNLPWWATENSNFEKKSTHITKQIIHLSGLYSMNPEIQVLASEELSPNENKRESAKLFKTVEKHSSTILEQKPRRKRKLTTIAKVMRHITEEIQLKRNEIKNRYLFLKASDTEKDSMMSKIVNRFQESDNVPKPVNYAEKPNDSFSNASTKLMYLDKVNNTETNLKRHMKFLKGSKIAQKITARNIDLTNIDEINNKIIENKNTMNQLLNLVSGTKDDPSIDKKVLRTNKVDDKSSITSAEKIIEAKKEISTPTIEENKTFNIISKFEKKDRKDDSSKQEFEIKKISDKFIPIEKRKDGTLIDYGLKVPTRKPKPKPMETLPIERLEIETNIPQKINSFIEQTQEHPEKEIYKKKLSLPIKINSEISKDEPTFQTNSEPPKSDISEYEPKINRQLSKLKEQDEIMKNIKENVAFFANAKRGKSGSDPASGKTDDSGGILDIENKKDKDNSKTDTSNSKDTKSSLIDQRKMILMLLNSKMISVVEKNDIEKSNISLTNLQSSRSKSDICNIEFKSNDSKNKFIYSAGLSRCHTRKHDKTILT